MRSVSFQSIRVHSACLHGIDAREVTVEVSMTSGLPGITIVGMADASIMEARSRIRCALRNAGYEVPRKKIVINLSPGDMKKTGSGFDLPIAVGILVASGQLPLHCLDNSLYVGELSLNGEVQPVRGAVAYQFLAEEKHYALVVSSKQSLLSHDDLDAYGLFSIDSLRHGLKSCSFVNLYSGCDLSLKSQIDYADVIGQDVAKRALAVAAVGDLNVLMLGPAGSGKTMLAERFPTIMEPVDSDQLIDAIRIHSVANEDITQLLEGKRPFRHPHHSMSVAGMIGGGKPVRPGEISLAHKGVLFLDEFAEFPNNVLQTLRQPLEEGTVRIGRVDGMYEFPCEFQLIAASNPCPCGNLGDDMIPCTCSVQAIEKYQAKLGGPLADRIDMSFMVRRPKLDLILSKTHDKVGSNRKRISFLA